LRKTGPFLLGLTLLGATGLGCAGAGFLQPTPTPTATPTSTPAPTPTSTPAPTLPGTITTRTLADGSTEFIDPEIGYRLVLPAEWLVLELGAEDMEQALQEAAELNPQFAPLIGSFGTLASQGMRLMALELDPRALTVGYPTNVVLVSLDGMGLPLDYLLEGTALSVEGMFPGSELISYGLIDDLNGSTAGRIELRMPLTTAAGTSVTIRSTWILLQAGDRLIELTLQAEDGLYAEDESRFERIVQSMELLGE